MPQLSNACLYDLTFVCAQGIAQIFEDIPTLKTIFENKQNDITAFDMAEIDDTYIKKARDEFENLGIAIKWFCGKDYLKHLH